MEEEKKLDISWSSIFKICFAAIFIYFLYTIRSILSLFLFSFVFFLSFEPFVDFLTKIKIPRAISTIVVYLGLLLFFLGFFYLAFLPFSAEFQEIKAKTFFYFSKLFDLLKEINLPILKNENQILQSLDFLFSKILASSFQLLFGIFGKIFTLFLIFTIAFFLSLEKEKIKEGLSIFLPAESRSIFLESLDNAKNKVFLWWQVKVLGSLFVGLATFLIALLCQIKYKTFFAFVATILNLLPIIGPIVSGFLIFVLTSFQSFILSVYFLFAFIVIQQIEGNFISPILTKKAIGISPIIVLFSVLVGQSLWGIIGGILTIPFLAILFESAKNFFQSKQSKIE